MKLSTAIAVLLSASVASANPFYPRQESTASSSVSSTSSISSSSASSSATSASSVDSTASPSSTAPTQVSQSVSSTSSGTSASSPTGSDLPSGCTQDEANTLFTEGHYTGTVALCGFEGGNNTIFVGDTKKINWYAGGFGSDGQVDIELNWLDKSGRTEWHGNASAGMGHVYFTATQDMIHFGNSANYSMALREKDSGNFGVSTIGPNITILVPNTTPQPPPPTSFNFLGVVIGVPVSVAVIVAVLAVFCCMTKKHRSFFSGIRLPTRRRGYGVRQSRRQRTGNATEDFDFDASAPIYRDEPADEYAQSSREERSARAMGVFSAERNLHSTY